MVVTIASVEVFMTETLEPPRLAVYTRVPDGFTTKDHGLEPTEMVVVTVLVAVFMTDTVLDE